MAVGLRLLEIGDVARQLLFLAARAGQVAAQRLDLLLQIQHAAAHLGVLIHQTVLRGDRLIEPLTQIENGLAGLIVTEQLRVRALPRDAAHRQNGGAKRIHAHHQPVQR